MLDARRRMAAAKSAVTAGKAAGSIGRAPPKKAGTRGSLLLLLGYIRALTLHSRGSSDDHKKNLR